MNIERLYTRKKRNNRILLKTSKDYANYTKENYYYTYGRMYNDSIGGIYFEYDRAIQPGVEVYLKILDLPMKNKNGLVPLAHKSHKAKVKWCRQIKGSSDYGIGAQYFEDETRLPFSK